MCASPSGKWKLIGVASNGDGCAYERRPGLYTRVAPFLEWIKRQVGHRTYSTLRDSHNTMQCRLLAARRRRSAAHVLSRSEVEKPQIRRGRLSHLVR